MRIHKEGRVILRIEAILMVVLTLAAIRITKNEYIIYPVIAVLVLMYLLTLWFFRFVVRTEINDANAIIAPCDGKIVVIEPSNDSEFLNEESIQISILMSPFDVHMNWFPVSGKILYSQLHKRTHSDALAAKESIDNEHSTVVIETEKKHKVMIRQIARAMVRPVVCYAKEGDYVDQNGNLGFVKFGSRVDLFLPRNAVIKVDLNQKVIGTQTVIARLK
jgi:phosphatidylserine decarboxylase